jgi:hypothetical protein
MQAASFSHLQPSSRLAQSSLFVAFWTSDKVKMMLAAAKTSPECTQIASTSTTFKDPKFKITVMFRLVRQKRVMKTFLFIPVDTRVFWSFDFLVVGAEMVDRGQKTVLALKEHLDHLMKCQATE